ncbi:MULTISPECIES: hypothetical protein [Pantoea]|uniref:hypothetical protein n=1 Tax=Pantoea TaxID=53335 RepID=UPI00057C4416|nr:MULTISPECIES: hypothetical protein [Pantoea]
MKNIRNIILIIVATLSTTAMADNPKQIGETLTQTADIVFSENIKLSFQLISKQGLIAGKTMSQTNIASFKITATPATRLGLRFTPNTGETVNASQFRLIGKNDPKHKIYVYYPPLDMIYLEKGNWLVTKDKKATLSGDIKTHSDQDIPADTYILSMDASAFIS